MRRPPLPVIVIGPQASVQDAVETMRAGAADYLTKPLAPDALDASIRRVLVTPELTQVTQKPVDRFDLIVSVSPQMQLMKQLAREVALTDAAVLITGESGTGKELFAQPIHAASPRAHGPLVALNCAGIPEHLLESELFGHHQGAFTDAKHTKPGRFQMAEGGTLFLDEIGEMSPAAQAKLLRVLEDHNVDPLGDTHSHKVNIRVIAATNEDLPAHIKTGRFRLDLYYRLNVYQLRLPPLRGRTEDIEPILQRFLEFDNSLIKLFLIEKDNSFKAESFGAICMFFQAVGNLVGFFQIPFLYIHDTFHELGIEIRGIYFRYLFVHVDRFLLFTIGRFKAGEHVISLGAPLILQGGDRSIRRVGWCSGAAQDYLAQAASLGLDAFISGEASERTFHEARELGIHYFAAGHHATERYGVSALGSHLAQKYGLTHHFLDSENPV